MKVKVTLKIETVIKANPSFLSLSLPFFYCVFSILYKLTSVSFTIGFCLLAIGSHSQNLVYNPGFESDSAAPITTYSQLKAGQTLVDGWYVPTDGTSDYWNSHKSTIKGHPIPKARTGQGRISMIWSNAWMSPYREFITGRLIKPLEKNKKYKVSFYICRYKYANYSPMQIGAYFSADSMIQRNYHANIRVTPQMKIEDYTILDDRKYWHKVEAVFTANGGEKFITLGNFKQTINDNTSPSIKVSSKFTIVATRGYAYCFVDDVCVEEYSEENTEQLSKKKLFVFLVDASSSMKKEDKYEKVKSGLKKSLKKLPYDSEFAVFTFSNRFQKILDPTNSLLYDLADALDTVNVKGQTNAVSALNQLCDFSELNEKYEIEWIMCTDGHFKLDDSTQTRIINSDICFNLLQIGSQRNMYLENLMNLTGGKYVVSHSKNIKEDIRNLIQSAAINLNEVEYTRAVKKYVIMKWTLLACLIALAVTI